MDFKFLRKFFIVANLILLWILCGCSDSKNDIMTSKDGFMLDTLVSIKLYGEDNYKVLEDSFDKISEFDDILNLHREGSDLYNIKFREPNSKVVVSEVTLDILTESIYYFDITNGMFDITLGPLIELWSESKELVEVPTQSDVLQKLNLSGIDEIVLDEKKLSVALGNNMFLDLGGIAKGYIADEIKSYLLVQGIESAIIDLGGNINIIGSKPDNSDYGIGIRNPFGNASEYLGVLNISDTSIVTSGDYERYYEVDGEKYHHIIDPTTGFPVENELKSVAIVSENSMQADVFSTAVFLMGLTEGYNFIENIDGADAIFVTKDKKIYITDGLRDNFFITNNEFEVIED